MAREDGFNDNKGATKSVTGREGDGLTASTTWNTMAASPFNTYEVSVKKGGKPSDATEVYTGPGTGTAQGVGSSEDVKGWVTDTGNRVTISGTPGSESIELIHHSGAQIIIDVDGSIFLMPTGKKGFGLHANKGDGVVSAQGRLILKGHSDITIETEGSMNFNVGQNMFMHVGGDMVVDVGGSYSESIDGAKTMEVVKDISLTTGAAMRETVAGDKRTQVVGDIRYDAGKNIESRADKDINLYSQKSVHINSKQNSTYEVNAGKLTMLSSDDFVVGTNSGMYISSKDAVAIEAAAGMALRATGSLILSSKATAYLDAVTKLDIRSAAIDLSATGQFRTLSGSTKLNSTSTFTLDSTGAVDLRGSTIDLNKGSPSAATTNAVETDNLRALPAFEAPEAPEFPDANTIIDNMTSERESPNFPKNANKMSAHEMSIYQNEGDTPDPKAKARSDQNASAGSLYSKGDDAGTIPDSSLTYDGSGNTLKAVASPYLSAMPTSVYNSSEKLSRSVTVGGFPGLGTLPKTQMGYSQKEILENVMHLAYNIMDPLLEKFGSTIHFSHGIRLGQGGSRHYIGKAVDCGSASRSHAETAMIAKWIVENLPYDRVFLEANHQGTIHCHVEAAPAGTSGAKTVWTCAEPSCHSKQDGLVLSYAEQGLKNMGFA